MFRFWEQRTRLLSTWRAGDHRVPGVGWAVTTCEQAPSRPAARTHTGDMGRIIGTILGAILSIWLVFMAAGGIFATLKTFLITGLIAMAIFIVVWLVARRLVAANTAQPPRPARPEIPFCAPPADRIERTVPLQIGYRVSSNEQRRLQEVTGLGWRCGVPESVCVAHGVLRADRRFVVWQQRSRRLSAVTGRRVRRSVPAAGRRGRSGGRTPRSCGQAPRAARWCLRLA